MNQRDYLINQIQTNYPKLDGFLAGLLADLWLENKCVDNLLEDDCNALEEHIFKSASSGGKERVSPSKQFL